ncbi:hypothetical protein GGS21DRAFT_47697 [Xylaria nigripes]|nr:hypothetical protein GGS21DRAFT_47697 [Xylaria nigripes]
MPDVASMEPDIKPVADENNSALQQYPLPVAEAQHPSSLYTNDHSHVDHERQPIEQPAQSYEHEHRHPDQGPRSPSPRLRTEDSVITSAEELQLAAQLSQDLSHGITMLEEPSHHHSDDHHLRNGTAQHDGSGDTHIQTKTEEEPEHHREDQQQPEQGEHLTHDLNHHEGQYMPHVAPLPLSNGEASATHTEPALQPSPGQPSQSPFLSDEQQSLEQQTLQQQSLEQQPQYLPEDQRQHHEQMQQQFVSDQPPPQALSAQQPQPLQQARAPLLQPHNGLDQLAQQYATHAYHSVQDQIPPRKRSKVSRACDECRRKKVKCDAASETGEDPCSNCRRSAIHCLFSRIPQKRGPSKGYIKELADRINHIEGKLANEGSLDALTEILGGGRRESSDIFSPPAQPDESSRKRPYSSITGADFGTPNTSRQGNWNSEPRPIQPYQTPPNGAKGMPYSANELAPQPLTRPDTETSSRAAASLNEIPMDLNQSAPRKELINDAFGVYLNVVHPCFPFLAGTKGRVEAQLAQCPPLLQDAFIEAFYGTMQSCVSAPGLYTNGDIGSATRIVAAWESDPSSPRNPLTNLVHLQALILMAIATDNYGTSSLKGEHGGPSKASILGRAVGLAYSMRLHVTSCSASPDAEQHGESDESITIRTWWTLVMLDRWNALSTASPLFIPNDSVVILPGLVSVLGESVYHLTRLSNILGHFAPVSLAPPQALLPDVGAVPILNSFFNLAIELFREVLPANITPATHPILNLVYWHSRLLSYLFQTNARSQDVIWACKESVDLLLNNTALLSPLNHHFFSLTTLSLLELANLDKTREEVTPMLKELLTRNLAPSTWDGIIRDRITERLQPSTEQAATDQSLQHLANLATASKGDASRPENVAEPVTLRTSTTYSHLGFDPRPILRLGYLNVLAEGSASGASLG